MLVSEKLHYEVLGEDSSPKLVFLHGLMGFSSNWKSFARKLSASFQCLIYDQRGHGRSFQPEFGYGLEHYAEDLNLLMEELGWERAAIVGHSMGGRVATQFAATFPERVSQLVVVDIGAVSDQSSMDHILKMLEFVPTPFEGRTAARTFFDTDFIQTFQNQVVKQFFYANLEKKSESCFDWKFSKEGIRQTLADARQRDLWAAFETLQPATLLVRGALSEDLPQEQFDEILSRNQSIEGIIVPDCGHWVHVEKPEEMLNILEKFLVTTV